MIVPRPQTSMGFRAGISGPGSSTPNTPQQLAPMSAIDSHLTAYPLRGYVSAQAPVASPSSSRVGQSAHAYNYTCESLFRLKLASLGCH